MKENNLIFLKVLRYFGLFGVMVLGLMTIIATAGIGDDDDVFDSSSGGTGTLSLGLTDSITDDYDAVYVTIKEVRVHMSGDETDGEDGNGNGDGDDEASSWEVIVSGNTTYNLLELVNGVIEQLGIGELEAGHYTQMRLILGEEPDAGTNISGVSHYVPHYVIDKSGVTHELTVPSGYQSGIKLVHGFDIDSGVTTELLLDFDASKSLHSTGSGKIILRPTIKVLDAITISVISGQVLDGEEGIGGVYVSAQIYDPEAKDPKDEIVVSAGTITDENGDFTLRLGPGNYNVVAYMDGYHPACFNIVAENSIEYTQDINLQSGVTETFSYEVSGTTEGVNISIRQEASCLDAEGTPKIEVKSFSIPEGPPYDVSLQSGVTYLLVASNDKETQTCDEWISGVTCELIFTKGK